MVAWYRRHALGARISATTPRTWDHARRARMPHDALKSSVGAGFPLGIGRIWVGWTPSWSPGDPAHHRPPGMPRLAPRRPVHAGKGRGVLPRTGRAEPPPRASLAGSGRCGWIATGRAVRGAQTAPRIFAGISRGQRYLRRHDVGELRDRDRLAAGAAEIDAEAILVAGPCRRSFSQRLRYLSSAGVDGGPSRPHSRPTHRQPTFVVLATEALMAAFPCLAQ
jgi:hypothetical protein